MSHAETIADPLDAPLSSLALTTRTYRTLVIIEGLKTVRELVGYSELELRRVPNMGIVSIREVIERLAERGMALKGYETPSQTIAVKFPDIYERLGHIEAMLQVILQRLP